ncbi:Hsp20/alpha crystallin family protein [Streptomyces sp. NPDC049627]|uniref:Hsp20/alpha crystallin family protein n=1 Tax=Streptomyces sp. NPDC049627 TaxID=3365595 RepID=UPI0037947A05
MLMRTDPFRELDRLTQQALGTRSWPTAMPMEAYRADDAFVVHFDIPGVDPETIDLNVDRNILTVRVVRRSSAPDAAQVIAAERPTGTYSRQLFLGDSLDTERIDASYDAGVLTLRIPVAEEAKSRKIQISGGEPPKQIDA